MSLRLLATLAEQFETLDRYAVAHGVPDLYTLDLRRLCNYVYWFLTKDGDEQGVAKMRARLWQPPKGERPDARSPWSAENEGKAFAAFASSVGISQEQPTKRAARKRS